MGKIDRPPQLSPFLDLRRAFGTDHNPHATGGEAAEVDFPVLLEQALAGADLAAVVIEKGDAVEGGRRSVRRALEDYPEQPQKRIDLHQCTVEEALFETRRFIDQSRAEGLLNVLIITGRGIHSEGGIARIRPVIENKLRSLKRDGTIVDFTEGNGGGAFKVFLPKAK